eukprot:TRINITY_DN17601_c0_g1_i1.p1 TRINITY_DN17601_c0_g1~~TRINITY_DN17601_c0_g1_i1.p1  ORF type:complete len:492 (+),score=165.84 TRINITY_DN17601_c0_g1_i1:128-1603(+)
MMFQVENVMEDVGELMSGLAQEKSLGLYFEVDDQVPPLIVGDPEKLHQILLNLVGNAIKFTESGEILVRCSAAPRDPSALSLTSHEEIDLLFEVRDSGMGIDATQQEQLFSPFFQADSSTTRRFGGTGLGLAICSQLVRLMGSKIKVESSVGTGSTFSFNLKFKSISTLNTEQAVLPSFTPTLDPGFLNRMRVIVVSNSETCQRVVSSILAGLSLSCDYVSATREHVTTTIRSLEDESPMVSFVCDDSSLDLLVDIFSEEADRGFRPSSIIMLGGTPRSQLAISTQTPIHYIMQPTTRSKLFTVFQRLNTSFIELTSAPDSHPSMMDDDHHASIDSSSKADSVPMLKLPEKPTPQEEKEVLRTVLVVEDNVVNTRVIVRHLAKLGLPTDTADNGAKAVEMFQSHPPTYYGVVLMDCHMPVMDGFEATIKIREIEAGRSHVPIVALTANVMPGITEQCTKAGMDCYLSKPVNFKALNSTIMGFLKTGKPDIM